TIGTGAWQGTAVAYAYGGTGLTSLGSANQCLTTNSGATAMAWASCTGSIALPLTVSGATSGGIPYFNSSVQMSSSGALALNAIVIGGGAGAAPTATTTGTGVLTAIGIAVNTSGGLATSAVTTLSSLTTVGTIGTGTWQGTAVGYAYGGTGLTALGSANQCLTTNSGVTAMAWASCSTSIAFPVTVSGATSGAIPYFNSTVQMSSSALLAANSIMIGGGAGAAPSTITTGAGVLTALETAVNVTNGISTYPVAQSALAINVGLNGSFTSQDGAITTGHCLEWGPGVQDTGASCGAIFLYTISSISSNTSAATGNYLYVCNAASGNVTLTLPSAASTTGYTYILKKSDSSTNTCILSNSGNIDGTTTQTIYIQYQSLSAMSDGSTYRLL